MRIYQTWRDYLAQTLFLADLPAITDLTRRWIVGLHVDAYLDFSERDEATREPHFREFFDAAMDVYIRASKEGYPEIHARELTHVIGTWHFATLGWGELIEFPPAEDDAYYERYADFYDRYGCSPDDPLGDFTPPGGLPEAPETPERMDEPFPLSEPGLADEVYALAPELDRRLPNGNAPKGDLDVTEQD